MLSKYTLDALRGYGLTETAYEQLLEDVRLKEQHIVDIDWQELVDKYNLDIHYDTLRKASQTIFGGAFVYNYLTEKQDGGTDESYLSRIQQAEISVKKERQKLSDLRTALNKTIRESSRRESMYDMMAKAIDEHVPNRYDYEPNSVECTDTALIVHVTDIHAGMEIDSPFNTFNAVELDERLGNLLDSVIEIQETHNASDAYVILGGDLIHGLIHVNSRLESKENVVEQIMSVSDSLLDFLHMMSGRFHKIHVYSVPGNHGRAIANKEDNAAGENFDTLVYYICKKAMSNVCNVVFHDNELHHSIAAFHVFDHMVYAVHGDLDKARTNSLHNVVTNMQRMARKAGADMPDLIFIGHLHTSGLTTVDDVKVIETGCLSGADSFAIDHRLVGTPEQSIVVTSRDKKLKALYNIPV